MPGSDDEETQKNWFEHSPADFDSTSQPEEEVDRSVSENIETTVTSTSVLQASGSGSNSLSGSIESSSSTSTRRNNPRSGKMESNHKAVRPPPMKPLAKEEAINTFET